MLRDIFYRRSKLREKDAPVDLDAGSTSTESKGDGSSEETFPLTEIPKLKRSKSFSMPINTKEIEDRANSMGNLETSFDPFSPAQLKKSHSFSGTIHRTGSSSFTKLFTRSVQFNGNGPNGKIETAKKINMKAPETNEVGNAVGSKDDLSIYTVHQQTKEEDGSSLLEVCTLSSFNENTLSTPNNGLDSSKSLEKVQLLFSENPADVIEESSDYGEELISKPQDKLGCFRKKTSSNNPELLKLLILLNAPLSSTLTEGINLAICTLGNKDMEILSLQDDLRHMNDAYSKNSGILSEQITEEINQKHNLTTQINEMTEKLAELNKVHKEELGTLLAKTVFIEDYNILIEEKQILVSMLEKHINCEVESLHLGIQLILDTNHRLESERKQLFEEINYKQSTVEELNEVVNEKTSIIDNLTRGLDASIEEKKCNENALEENIIQLGAKIFDLESTVESLNTKNSKLQDQLNIKIESLRGLCTTIDDLHKEFNYLEETKEIPRLCCDKNDETSKSGTSTRVASETLLSNNGNSKIETSVGLIENIKISDTQKNLELEVSRLTQVVGSLEAENDMLKSYNEEATKLLLNLQDRFETLRKSKESNKEAIHEFKASNKLLYLTLVLLLKGAIESLSPVFHKDSLHFCNDLYNLISKKSVFSDGDMILLERLPRFIISAITNVVSQYQSNEQILEKEIEKRNQNYSEMLANLTKVMEDKIEKMHYSTN
ncbi:uncharacterized protein CANTADRAFT_5864 [Suhomyces tanzawaensis NRRL Y-17324]|uniref:Uncharacterized protein n=1 Tax=Suhomyces tanzawaensis NRRL Y-17324 TaxID=984487 RepID=A0A1E4SL94_9ASCO|nr:uncharacterized protein CANTADRAFT_5864 [Suhomyces tanzawaensis NRRL Y-17324]ODV80202.1 hypothetical protein CANTADRAFT_5864 [Suhomyces tanzawaensis NRRL Y-17324]